MAIVEFLTAFGAGLVKKLQCFAGRHFGNRGFLSHKSRRLTRNFTHEFLVSCLNISLALVPVFPLESAKVGLSCQLWQALPLGPGREQEVYNVLRLSQPRKPLRVIQTYAPMKIRSSGDLDL